MKITLILLSILSVCLFLFRGWIYHSKYKEKISIVDFLKKYYEFDLGIILSIINLNFKKGNAKLNTLTVILWILILIIVLLLFLNIFPDM